ncbi:MAG: hypothetical protein IKN04_21285 [Clostridia bacterium]|nr:hypothetical protein [Clostridia bacterium]
MMKRMIGILAALVLLCGLVPAGCAEETVTFSWWIPRNEDTSYYDNYRQNPVIQYLLETRTYAGKKLELEFQAGISGSERENFSNMLSTESLTDVFNLAYCDYTAETLLEDGYIMDLTELIQQYMPNYMALIENDPELASFAYSYVDGEKRLLTIMSMDEIPADPFEGFCYRRDWIAKYGKNPVTGEPFTYNYDENGNMQDDVVFPSGGTYPIYISDWEWMFGIFTEAMQALGIQNSYCISIYYQGFNQAGDMFSPFGGGGPNWYRDQNGNAAFGATSEAMRAYLRCMNTWYKNGWLDKAFAQRSGDMFFAINSTAVHQGAVPMWQGRQAEVGNQMDMHDGGLTEGIWVCGAPQPINDVYGDDSVKGVQPYTFFTYCRANDGIAINKNAAKKDLAVLLSFIDQLYSFEGACIHSVGLSKEILEASGKDTPWYQTMAKFGLTEGIYELQEENGETYIYHNKKVDTLLLNAMMLNRVSGYRYNNHFRYSEAFRPAVLTEAIALWRLYTGTGYLQSNVTNLISAKDSSKLSKIKNNVVTYMSQNVPKFILGQKGFDIDNDTDWKNFCKTIEKYGVDKVTKMYQEALDTLAR